MFSQWPSQAIDRKRLPTSYRLPRVLGNEAKHPFPRGIARSSRAADNARMISVRNLMQFCLSIRRHQGLVERFCLHDDLRYLSAAIENLERRLALAHVF